MIIIELADQLGNQMFGYASGKSLALDKGYEFAYYQKSLKERYVNDKDDIYGKDIGTIFNIPSDECTEYIPDQMVVYKEAVMKKRFSVNYIESVKNEIRDNMYLQGHFISTDFFKHRLDTVREWFKLPDKICAESIEKVNKLSDNGKYTTVSVHFRVGKDYQKRGNVLKSSYWWKAAKYVQTQIENPIFICVYDQKSSIVKKFIEEFDAIDERASLVSDMGLISNCDVNIICNSTFSVWAAILNKKSKITICPGHFPAQRGHLPDSIFLDSWIRIGKGERNFISKIYHIVRLIFNRK